MQMPVEVFRFTSPLQGGMLDNTPSPGPDREGKEGIALMEAALMASPQAAVNGPRRRKRTKYNHWQKSLLERAYAVCKYPNVWTRETLSKALNVDDARIIVWFQNRRARYSRQSAAGRHRAGAPSSDVCEPRLPTGTLHYANTPGPSPSLGPPGPCCAPPARRPLADLMLGRGNALPPAVAEYPPAAGLKLEYEDSVPSCAVGQGWYTLAGSPAAPAGPPARYPVDEIEVDFTVADFNVDWGNQYLLDLSPGM